MMKPKTRLDQRDYRYHIITLRAIHYLPEGLLIVQFPVPLQNNIGKRSNTKFPPPKPDTQPTTLDDDGVSALSTCFLQHFARILQLEKYSIINKTSLVELGLTCGINPKRKKKKTKTRT